MAFFPFAQIYNPFDMAFKSYDILFGTPKEKAKTVLNIFGGSKKQIEDVDKWTWKGAEKHLTPLGQKWEDMPVNIPGLVPDVLGGLKETAIIAAVAIGGLYLAGKFLGGKK